MKIKIYQYVNGKFIWWWTRYYSPSIDLRGKLSLFAIDSNNFGIDATIENYFNGEVSLMAMIQNQLK